MKFILKTRHQNSSKSIHREVREELEKLTPSLQIDEAHVVLERDPEASPAFRASAHLVTPGPDVFGAAQDHTLAAALRKMVAQLKRRIAQRHEKRARRMRNQLSGGLRLATMGARS